MHLKNITAPAVAIAIMAAGLHGCGTAPQETEIEQSAVQNTESETDTGDAAEQETEEDTAAEEEVEAPAEETTPEETPETVSENTAAEAAPEFEIEPMDETTMYATQTCNVRSGPSTDHDVVSRLTTNQEVTVNGKVTADNGKPWYVLKTDDGSIQMVSGSLLSDAKVSAGSTGTSTDGQSGSTATGGSTTQAPSDCAESDCIGHCVSFCEGWTVHHGTYCVGDDGGITAE